MMCIAYIFVGPFVFLRITYVFHHLTSYGAHSHQCQATIANHTSQSQNMHFPQLQRKRLPDDIRMVSSDGVVK